MTKAIQAAKRVVLDYYAALDAAPVEELGATIRKFTAADYHWRAVHPFHELSDASDVAERFWAPVRSAFSPLQRRPDIFLAGPSSLDDSHDAWVCQMGHLLGLFDAPWLAIPPTGKMCFIRYAEFHRVSGSHIAETALFVDLISVMRQAGHYPLPPQTGASHIHPGPRTHDGILREAQDVDQGLITMGLVDQMISDLFAANETGNRTGDNRIPRSVLAKSWHDDMIWNGPDGIGATYTIDRYQQQHQNPFRFNLSNKRFNGHVTRFAEGEYACFFGWANLTNTADGGFMGLPGNNTPADMRVVDLYRRDGDKLAENWVFIDLLHWLAMQGLDVLARMRQLNGEEL